MTAHICNRLRKTTAARAKKKPRRLIQIVPRKYNALAPPVRNLRSSCSPATSSHTAWPSIRRTSPPKQHRIDVSERPGASGRMEVEDGPEGPPGKQALERWYRGALADVFHLVLHNGQPARPLLCSFCGCFLFKLGASLWCWQGRSPPLRRPNCAVGPLGRCPKRQESGVQTC